MSRRILLVLAAFALLVSVVVLPHGRAAATTSGTSAISFSAPSIVAPVHTYGEPDVKIAPNGACYASGPWGTGTQRSIWNMSLDGCRSFRPLHDSPITSANQSDTTITGPGGGDTEISIDRSGKAYYADLAALTELKVATWNPATKTMQVGQIHNGSQPTNGYDRQWFAG